jgi:hypothetical protein
LLYIVTSIKETPGAVPGIYINTEACALEAPALNPFFQVEHDVNMGLLKSYFPSTYSGVPQISFYIYLWFSSYANKLADDVIQYKQTVTHYNKNLL